MKRSRYPALHVAAEETLDWRDGKYTAKVDFEPGCVRVEQAVVDCPQIDVLVHSGDVLWAVELRSPTTLFAKVVELGSPISKARYDPEEVGGVLYAIPGLLATNELELDQDGLSNLWHGEPVIVPPGTWLARGPIIRRERGSQSLLAFDIDPSLPPGTIQVYDPMGVDVLQFVVYLSSDLAGRDVDPMVRHAALVGAFARLPRVADGLEVGSGAHRHLTEIQRKLRNRGVPDWVEDSDFDSALAATAFEAIPELPSLDEDGEM